MLLAELAGEGVSYVAEASEPRPDQYWLDGVRLAAAALLPSGRDHGLSPHRSRTITRPSCACPGLLPQGVCRHLRRDDPWSQATIDQRQGRLTAVLTVTRRRFQAQPCRA